MSISTMRTSSTITAAVATNAEGFSRVSRLKTLRRSLRTLSRLNTWKNTNVTKAMVPATVGTPSLGSVPGAYANTTRVPAAMTALASRIRSRRGRVRMRSWAAAGDAAWRPGWPGRRPATSPAGRP
jgi:hypothetical protein